MTPWSEEIVCIGTNPTKIQKATIKRKAENMHISSVVVYEDNKPIGYSVVGRWKDNVEGIDYTKFRDKHNINSNSSLSLIIQRFCELASKCNKTNSPPIFLVNSKPEKKSGLQSPIGLMTYWDVNRRSVYSYIYSVMVFIEQVLKEEIYNSHSDSNISCLRDFVLMRDSSKKKPRELEDWEDGLRANISKLTFRELCDFRSVDIHVTSYSCACITEDILSSMLALRNKIAHPVNLILDGGPARLKSQLETLRQICKEGREMVTKYDSNPKNSMCSTPLNDI